MKGRPIAKLKEGVSHAIMPINGEVYVRTETLEKIGAINP